MKRTRYTITIIGIILHFHTVAFTQNVGIGNPSPSEKLDVAGNVKADTVKSNALRIAPNAGTGKVLTSDAMGNGNWEMLTLDSDESDGNLGYGVWGDCQTNNNITAFQPVADTTATIYEAFGWSVSISGDYAIVGSPNDDDQFNNQGSVSIYHHDGTEWVFFQKLTDPNPSPLDELGGAVETSGDYVFAASQWDDEGMTNQGSVSVFQFDGTSWVFLQKLVDPDGAANDRFGFSISVSGNFLIVGALYDDVTFADQGSACIFQLNGNSWEYMTKLTEATGSAGDWFGYDVSISPNTCIVGIPTDDDGGSDEGAAMIFQFDGTTWNFQQKIFDPEGATYDLFGSSVDIHADKIIVGVPYDLVQFFAQGSACFFQYNGSSWFFVQKVTASNGEANDFFGTSVAISGNFAMVGSPNDNQGTNSDAGSATLFLKVGIGWSKFQEIVDPGSNFENGFGYACGLDSTTRRFLIGAGGYSNGRGKVLFGKIRE